MIALLGLALVLALFLWLVVVRVSVPAVISSILALPQVFQVVPFFFSGAIAWNVVTLPVMLMKMKASLWRGVPALLAGLALLHLLYLPFSLSPGRGVLEVSELLSVLGPVLAMVIATAADRRVLKLVMFAGLPFFVAQSVLTAVFLLNPAMERAYLTSSLAPFLSGGAVLDIFTTNYNNVIETFKAGGIFLNGNSASMTMGVAAFAYFGFGRLFASKVMTMGSFIMLAGAVFTGSKTGIGLAFVLPPAMYLIYRAASRGGLLLSRALAVLLGIPALALTVRFALSKAAQFTQESTDSVEIRSKIWDVAIDVIRKHPIVGSGFGAFNEELTRVSMMVGVPGSFPPHNFLFSIWIDVGLAGVLLVLAIYALMFGKLLRVVQRGGKRVGPAAISFIGALSWMFIHGMGDNTSFFGSLSTVSLFAAIVAASRSMFQDLRETSDLDPWGSPAGANRTPGERVQIGGPRMGLRSEQRVPPSAAQRLPSVAQRPSASAPRVAASGGRRRAAERGAPL